MENWEQKKDRVTDIYRREMGLSRPRSVARRFSASEVLVKQINLCGKLNGHKGCVNAVEFNSTGDFLVSGSDDKLVIFWDWADRSEKFAYVSGHHDNIFQTRIMPFTDDQKIVPSSADGQVRLAQIFEDGRINTKRLGKHQGCVYKLAVEPRSPHVFYSCGEDGFVQYFDLRSNSATRLFYCSSFTENSNQPPNSIRLNAIVIDPRNPNYFAVGGSDEYTRVYDKRKCHWDASTNPDTPVDIFCPRHLIRSNNVHITGLPILTQVNCFSLTMMSSYICLRTTWDWDPHHCVSLLKICRNLKRHRFIPVIEIQTVKGVSFFGPNDEYVMSGSDWSHIYLEKKGR